MSDGKRPSPRRSPWNGEDEAHVEAAVRESVRAQMAAQGLDGLPERTCRRLAWLLGPSYVNGLGDRFSDRSTLESEKRAARRSAPNGR